MLSKTSSALLGTINSRAMIATTRLLAVAAMMPSTVNKEWDVLIGGMGLDEIRGGSDVGHGDLLADGSTIHDNDAKRLRELSDVWSSGGIYEDIVDQLLTDLLTPANVSGDGDRDRLMGHQRSADLFFAEVGLDQLRGETDDMIFFN